MKLNYKLQRVCGEIVSNFRTNTLILQDYFNHAVISSLNRNHTAILKVIINREELMNVHSLEGMYVLPVKGSGYYNHNPELQLDAFREFNYDDGVDSNYFNACNIFSNNMGNDQGYDRYHFKVLNHKLEKIDESSEASHTIFKIKQKEFEGRFSIELLREVFFGDITNLWLKLLGNESPLCVRYEVNVADVKANVYGVIAPVLNEEDYPVIKVR